MNEHLRDTSSTHSTRLIKVLLIEDDPDDIFLVRDNLAEARGAKFEVECAERLSRGLDRLAAGGIDVVLLDLSLPDSSGTETFLQVHSEAPEVPIVMLTGLDDEGTAFQAVQGGAQDYLVKSQVDSPSLVRSLRYAVERHDLLSELVARTQELSRINSELESEIKERKRVEEALAAQANELERSNKELEQFAYIASHDLREPLRMVTSYVEILAEDYKGKLDSSADRYIGYAVDGASRMTTLIDDILAFSRVGTQRRPLEPTDYNDILPQVVAGLKIEIEDSGAVVTCDDLPTVNCDSTLVEQLFQNLISNGIKFRGEDPPHIHVSAYNSGDECVFSVRDNGIGIEPRHYERIFQMFQRLHHRSEYPGTGIGLALCHKIVERHGGRIWLESEMGKGFHFLFHDPGTRERGNPR